MTRCCFVGIRRIKWYIYINCSTWRWCVKNKISQDYIYHLYIRWYWIVYIGSIIIVFKCNEDPSLKHGNIIWRWRHANNNLKIFLIHAGIPFNSWLFVLFIFYVCSNAKPAWRICIINIQSTNYFFSSHIYESIPYVLLDTRAARVAHNKKSNFCCAWKVMRRKRYSGEYKQR